MPRVLHKLHDLFKFLLTFWSRRIDFYNLWLTIFTSLHRTISTSLHRLWLSLSVSTLHGLSLSLSIWVHHFFHHLLHHISMITLFLSSWIRLSLWIWRTCVTWSIWLLLCRVLLMRGIDFSFLAFSVLASHLFAMSIVALNFVAGFLFKGVHVSVFTHLTFAGALEGLLLDFSVGWIHSWHFSNVFESIGHMTLFIFHIGFHLMHWVFNWSSYVCKSWSKCWWGRLSVGQVIRLFFCSLRETSSSFSWHLPSAHSRTLQCPSTHCVLEPACCYFWCICPSFPISEENDFEKDWDDELPPRG